MSPYDGIDLETLLQIKLNLVKLLTGKRFQSQNVPGLSYTRRIESLAEVRTELVYVTQAIENLEGNEPITRSFLKAV